MPYEFTDSDFTLCKDIIQFYFENTDHKKSNAMWVALQDLISEIGYGGRITDDSDRKLLKIYASEFFCNDIFTPGWKPSGAIEYVYPDVQPKQQDEEKKLNVVGIIEELSKTLPHQDSCAIYGQHINAEITSQIQYADDMLSSLVTLQKGSIENRALLNEDGLAKMLQEVLDMFIEEYDVDSIITKSKADANNPLRFVMLQEVNRYYLLGTLLKSLINEALQAVRGLGNMTPHLESIVRLISLGVTPKEFLVTYPSTKSFGSWVKDFKERYMYFKLWSESGMPRVTNMSMFSNPKGFMVAVLQRYSRKTNTPLDQLIIDFNFPGLTDKSTFEASKDGAYIKGLSLEGAKWDTDNNMLASSDTMKLICAMPIMLLKPVKKNKKPSAQAMYMCPCYYYPVRHQVEGVDSFVCSIPLKCVDAPENDANYWVKFWTKRGTAILVTTSE